MRQVDNTDDSSSQNEKLIYFEGEFYARKDLDILLAARKISKRITARRVSSYKPSVFRANSK